MVGNLLYSKSTQLNVNIADPHGGPQGTRAGGGSGGGHPTPTPSPPVSWPKAGELGLWGGTQSAIGSCRMRAVLRLQENLGARVAHRRPEHSSQATRQSATWGPGANEGGGRERLTVAGLCASHLPSRLASLSPSPLPGFSISFLGWFCARPEVTVRTVSLAPRWPSAYWTPQVCAPCGERTLPAQQASQTHGAAGFGIHVDPQDPRAA